jgi:hypothetical protein
MVPHSLFALDKKRKLLFFPLCICYMLVYHILPQLTVLKVIILFSFKREHILFPMPSIVPVHGNDFFSHCTTETEYFSAAIINFGGFGRAGEKITENMSILFSVASS